MARHLCLVEHAELALLLKCLQHRVNSARRRLRRVQQMHYNWRRLHRARLVCRSMLSVRIVASCSARGDDTAALDSLDGHCGEFKEARLTAVLLIASLAAFVPASYVFSTCKKYGQPSNGVKNTGLRAREWRVGRAAHLYVLSSESPSLLHHDDSVRRLIHLSRTPTTFSARVCPSTVFGEDRLWHRVLEAV